MIRSDYFASTVDGLLRWARSHSLWYYSAGTSCCADETLQTFGSRYDLERFGARPEVDPAQADLLIVNGAVNQKAAPHLKKLYDEMKFPKYVMAVGACACGGGAFSPDDPLSTSVRLDALVPVDVYVPGCPPRPESIMKGLLLLQEKIRGRHEAEVRGET